MGKEKIEPVEVSKKVLIRDADCVMCRWNQFLRWVKRK
jgi:hypothetical protein